MNVSQNHMNSLFLKNCHATTHSSKRAASGSFPNSAVSPSEAGRKRQLEQARNITSCSASPASSPSGEALLKRLKQAYTEYRVVNHLSPSLPTLANSAVTVSYPSITPTNSSSSSSTLPHDNVATARDIVDVNEDNSWVDNLLLMGDVDPTSLVVPQHDAAGSPVLRRRADNPTLLPQRSGLVLPSGMLEEDPFRPFGYRTDFAPPPQNSRKQQPQQQQQQQPPQAIRSSFSSPGRNRMMIPPAPRIALRRSPIVPHKKLHVVPPFDELAPCPVGGASRSRTSFRQQILPRAAALPHPLASSSSTASPQSAATALPPSPMAAAMNSPEPTVLTLLSFPFRIIYANAAFFQLTHRNPDVVIGTSFYDLMDGEQFPTNADPADSSSSSSSSYPSMTRNFTLLGAFDNRIVQVVMAAALTSPSSSDTTQQNVLQEEQQQVLWNRDTTTTKIAIPSDLFFDVTTNSNNNNNSQDDDDDDDAAINNDGNNDDDCSSISSTGSLNDITADNLTTRRCKLNVHGVMTTTTTTTTNNHNKKLQYFSIQLSPVP